MKILHCIQSVAGGGAERQLVYLAGETVRQGHEVHVALLRDGAHYAALEQTGAVIHRIPSRSNYDPLVMPRLMRVIRKIKPDVVQTWLTQMDVFGGVAALLTGTPWVLSERSSEVGYTGSMKDRMRIALAKRATAIVSNSAGGDLYWQPRSAKRTLRRVVPNAVPLDHANVPAVDLTAHGLDPERPLMLYVGRFAPEKNLDTLFDALEIALAESEAAVALCGTGPLFDQYRQRLAKFPKGRAAMPGFVEQIWSWLRPAKALMSVGLYEGHPNAVMEAMAAGTPVIVSDIPAHREILDESSALFVDARSPRSIADAIVRTVDDPAAAAERAQRAKARVSEWSMPVIAGRYIDLYEEVRER